MKKYRSLPLLLLAAALMTGASKSEFYDTNFETAKLPVYLKGMLGEETTLSKISVRGVVPGSPAAQSGLRRGDEILTFGGHYLNHSARTLYQLLYKLYETQSPSLELQIRRNGQKRDIILEPDYDPAHVVLGIQYSFLQPSGRRARSVQFLKREISPDGVEHDAVYDFRDAIRVSTKCHWWGGKILVVEIDLFNDQKVPLSIKAEQIKVTDHNGNPLDALEPQTITGLIYNKEAIWSVNDAKFHWKKKEAEQMLQEIQMLQDDLAKQYITSAEIPAKSRFYGVLYYSMTPVQPPISITGKFGTEKFSLKFDFDKEIASHHYSMEPEEENTWSGDSGTPAESGSSLPTTSNYDILL